MRKGSAKRGTALRRSAMAWDGMDIRCLGIARKSRAAERLRRAWRRNRIA